MQADNKPIRKRTQIDNTNRTMFIWVAGASVVVGVASVLVIFLFQMMLFNEKVLAEKSKTVSIMQKNKDALDDLEENVKLLDFDQALMDAKASPDDKPIQVILDALPSEANSLALGSSLQNKLLSGINGLVIDSMNVDPIPGVESLDGTANTVDASQPSVAQGVITFKLVVRNNEISTIKQVLLNLEKSIRTIDVVNLKLEKTKNEYMLTIQGRAFYEPTKKINFTEKVIKQ